MQILQQRCWARGPQASAHPVYIPAKLLRSSTGRAMFKGVDQVVPHISCKELAAACDNVECVCWNQIADSVAANGLIPAKIAYDIPKCLVLSSRCDLHQSNLGVSQSCAAFELLNPTYCLHNVFKQEANQLDWVEVMGKLIKRITVHSGIPPPPGSIELSRWLAEATIGRTLMADRMSCERRLEFLKLHSRVWNGRLWLQELEHFCWGPSKANGRCHDTDLQVIEEAIACASHAYRLIFDPGRSPSDKDFFRNIDVLRPWAYLCGVHGLAPQGMLAMCPLTPADTEDSMVLLQDDDFKVRPKKTF